MPRDPHLSSVSGRHPKHARPCHPCCPVGAFLAPQAPARPPRLCSEGRFPGGPSSPTTVSERGPSILPFSPPHPAAGSQGSTSNHTRTLGCPSSIYAQDSGTGHRGVMALGRECWPWLRPPRAQAASGRVLEWTSRENMLEVGRASQPGCESRVPSAPPSAESGDRASSSSPRGSGPVSAGVTSKNLWPRFKILSCFAPVQGLLLPPRAAPPGRGSFGSDGCGSGAQRGAHTQGHQEMVGGPGGRLLVARLASASPWFSVVSLSICPVLGALGTQQCTASQPRTQVWRVGGQLGSVR